MYDGGLPLHGDGNVIEVDQLAALSRGGVSNC